MLLRTPGTLAIGIIQGDAVPQRFIPGLIELYRAGESPFDRLVGFYDFADINGVVDDARSGKTIKPILRIGSQCASFPLQVFVQELPLKVGEPVFLYG